MFSPPTFYDVYLQLSFLIFRSLLSLMNGAKPILPVHNTTYSDGTVLSSILCASVEALVGKMALPVCSALDSASIILGDSTYNQSGIIEESYSKPKLTFPNTTFVGSIRPKSPISQRRIPVRKHTSFQDNAPTSTPHGDLEASGRGLFHAYTSYLTGSPVCPESQTPQWPSIPHEAVCASVIMPVKKSVQHEDDSLTGTDPLYHKPLTGYNIEIEQDFYQRHLPTKPAPIVPRKTSCAQPGFIPPLSFNTTTNAPLLLPTAVHSERIYFQGLPSSAVNVSYSDRCSLLPVPVTTHSRQSWIPSLGHWVNSRLSAVLTCAPLGMLSNSDSMEEFLARFSNPEGLHKPWQQILDDLEHDLDPFRKV